MLPRRRAAGSGSSSAPFLQSCDALLSPATLALAQRSLAATPLREVCESSVTKSPPAATRNSNSGGRSSNTLYGTTVRRALPLRLSRRRARHRAHKSSAVQESAGIAHDEASLTWLQEGLWQHDATPPPAPRSTDASAPRAADATAADQAPRRDHTDTRRRDEPRRPDLPGPDRRRGGPRPRGAPETVAATLGTKAAFRRGLALLMVSMGLTLTPTDLKRASNSPRALAINAVCCFAVAPLASIACATALGLDADARAGLLLLGCVSGGQASNLCALLGGGDAALSVVLTTSTTLLGCVATPFLASRLLRSTIAVDGGAILASTASLVLAPLGAGVLTAALFPRVARRLRPFCAPAGIVSTSLLVAGGAAAAYGVLVVARARRRGRDASPCRSSRPGSGKDVGVERSGAAHRGHRDARQEPDARGRARARAPRLICAAVPAAGMIWLAVVGAAVAAGWGRVPLPPEDFPLPRGLKF